MGLKAVLRHKLNKDDRLEEDDKTEEDKNEKAQKEQDKNKNLQYRGFQGVVDDFSTLIYNEINHYNKLCEYDQAINTKTKEIFAKFPTCLMRSVLHHYHCRYDTWIRSNDLLHFSETCLFYELKNLKDVNKYVDCDGSFRRMHPDKKELINYNFGYNITVAGNKFIKYIDELCNKESIYKKALCAAYELRDECENNKSCISKFVQNKLNQNCPNKSFKRKARQLKDIFDLQNKNAVSKEVKIEPVYFDEFDILNFTILKETAKSERKLTEDQWKTKTFFTRDLKSIKNVPLNIEESNQFNNLNGLISLGILIFGLVGGVYLINKGFIGTRKKAFWTFGISMLVLCMILYFY